MAQESKQPSGRGGTRLTNHQAVGPGSCKGLGSFMRPKWDTVSLGEGGGVQRQCGDGSGLGDPSELSSACFLSYRSIQYCFEAEAARSCLHGDIEGLVLFTLFLPCCALRGRTRLDSQSMRSPGFCSHRGSIYCMLVALIGLSQGVPFPTTMYSALDC